MTPAARAAVAEGMARWANPSSPHAEGRAARAALEAARGEVAAAYGWPGEVLFTSGASESLALALGRSIAGGRVAMSMVEHDAVFRAAPPTARPLVVDAQGLLKGENWPTLLDAEGKALICVQWANSETGVRQPIAALAEAAHALGHLLLVDAAQMPASDELAAHADFVAVSGHKRGGPPGIGALLVRDLATLMPTGGQERGYRAGTENLPAILGFAAALAEPEPDHAALRARLDDAITRSGGEVVSSGAPRHPAIGSYRLPGVPATTQLIRLDMAGFAVSAGSACSSGSMKPSHVLAALGWPEAAGREVIRVSFGRSTSSAEVDAFIAAWRQMARATRTFAA
ncbi:aminotransferase class V-fold PLP-dependent enzyme [Sphingomonas rubra]